MLAGERVADVDRARARVDVKRRPGARPRLGPGRMPGAPEGPVTDPKPLGEAVHASVVRRVGVEHDPRNDRMEGRPVR